MVRGIGSVAAAGVLALAALGSTAMGATAPLKRQTPSGERSSAQLRARFDLGPGFVRARTVNGLITTDSFERRVLTERYACVVEVTAYGQETKRPPIRDGLLPRRDGDLRVESSGRRAGRAWAKVRQPLGGDVTQPVVVAWRRTREGDRLRLGGFFVSRIAWGVGGARNCAELDRLLERRFVRAVTSAVVLTAAPDTDRKRSGALSRCCASRRRCR